MRALSLGFVQMLVLGGAVLAELAPIVPADFRDAIQPQLAVGPDGKAHVVFGAGNSIYYTGSVDGRLFRPPVRIAQLEKLALKMRRGPRIVASDGMITVTAILHAAGTLNGWASGDGGATWQSLGPLNTVPKSSREGLHAMASNGRGLVALMWLDLRNGGMELWSRTSYDGGRTWKAEVRVYASPDGHICECCHPSVAVGPKGDIAVMWRNWLGGARDRWSVISTDGGRTFPQPRKLGTGTWPLKGCPMDGGGLTFDDRGAVATVWRREANIFASAPGAPESMFAAAAQQPVIAKVGNGLAVAYEQNGEVMLVVGSQAPRSLGKGRAPAMAANHAGVAFLAWESLDGSSPLIVKLP